jgi:hypothetical protein
MAWIDGPLKRLQRMTPCAMGTFLSKVVKPKRKTSSVFAPSFAPTFLLLCRAIRNTFHLLRILKVVETTASQQRIIWLNPREKQRKNLIILSSLAMQCVKVATENIYSALFKQMQGKLMRMDLLSNGGKISLSEVFVLNRLCSCRAGR